MTSPCPDACLSLEELESFLANGSTDDTVSLHLGRCASCRRNADRIRQNNAFMASLGSRVHDMTLPRPRPSADAFVEDLVGGYRIVSEIHRGGQGIVYKAVQLATKRKVALKILAHRPSVDARHRRRFDREVEIVAGLRHPNIVTVYDSGSTEDGRHFFAMELISGSTLDVYLAETKRDIRSIVMLLARIARAIQYAHQRGVTHRDVKPGNILIDPAGEPHVVDFGLAKLAGSLFAGGVAVSVSGEFVGTLKYASPEQVMGDSERIDIRTDVYSLGVVLYEALTGRLPYVISGSISDMVHTIAEVEPEPPSKIDHVIDDELNTIVLMSLAKDRARRYQSAGELAEDLERYLSNLAIRAKRDSTWYILKKTARRYRVHAALAASFVLAILVFAVFMTILHGQATSAEALAQSRAEDLACLLSASNIERGRAMISTGNLRGAEEPIWSEFIASGGPDFDSWGTVSLPHPGSAHAYWALWELCARGRCLATFRAHDNGVTSLAIQPGGNALASSGGDGNIRLWQLPLGEPIGTIAGSHPAGSVLTYSPNGQFLLSNVHRGPATLWDARTYTSPGSFGERITAARFSPDGLSMATGDELGAVRLWDVATLNCLKVVDDQGPEFPVTGVCMSADGAMIAWTRHQTIHVWDGHSIHSRELPTGLPHMLAGHPIFDPEQQFLLCSLYGGVLRWDLPFTNSTKDWLASSSTALTGLEFNSDGSVLATAFDDSNVMLWDTTESNRICVLTGHAAGVLAVKFVPNGSLLVTGCRDGTIRFWDLAPSGPDRPLKGHEDTVHSIGFSPDGMSLASASGDNTVRIWDWRAGVQVKKFSLPESKVINAVAYSEDGALLACGSEDHRINLWETATWKHLHVAEADTEQINTLAFSPDGRILASAGAGKAIKLWTPVPWSQLGTLAGHSSRISKVRFSPDGRTLASCSQDKFVILWDMADLSERARLAEHQQRVRAIAFSPDGKLLATGSDDWDIRLWDVESGACVKTLKGHQSKIYSVAFTPDNQLLASSADDGEIRLWDVKTERNVLIVQPANGRPVYGVAFSPDGATLATGGKDQQIHLWDLTYYQRHIAGSLEFQLQEYTAKNGQPANAQSLRTWARDTLSKPNL